MWCSAQGGQVAVLYHGDEIKTYYSSSAFKDAIANAADGDIITLSPGTYEATDITKAVTIRGAGIGAVDSNTTDNSFLTSISGNVNVVVPVNESGYTLSIEGIDFKGLFVTKDVQDAVFSKIRFNSLSDGSNSSDPCGRNLTFVHCLITNLGSLRLGGFNYYNCCVSSLGSAFSSPRKNETFINCIIYPTGGHNANGGYGVYRNCIFVSDNKESLSRQTDAYNCVWFGQSSDKGPYNDGNNGKPERHNSVVPDGTEIFVDDSFYVLNEAGLKYIGSDGTQVGLYGSELPFSTKTSYPRIKKLHIAPESTSDGKLKVEFELDADI